MEYTVYHLFKKAHNIRSPSQQLLFPAHVAGYATACVTSLERWLLLAVLTLIFLKLYDLIV